jgi:hypothetical protein
MSVDVMDFESSNFYNRKAKSSDGQMRQDFVTSSRRRGQTWRINLENTTSLPA